jgi:hypothetical protein
MALAENNMPLFFLSQLVALSATRSLLAGCVCKTEAGRWLASEDETIRSS